MSYGSKIIEPHIFLVMSQIAMKELNTCVTVGITHINAVILFGLNYLQNKAVFSDERFPICQKNISKKQS